MLLVVVAEQTCRVAHPCQFHALALALYHNFSFTEQLFSIFLLLDDTALSVPCCECYQRQPQTDKSPGFFCLVLFFFLGRREEESSRKAFFRFSGLLKL